MEALRSEACKEARRAEAWADAQLLERDLARQRATASLEAEAAAARACARRAAEARAASAGAATEVLGCHRSFFLASSADEWTPHEMLWNPSRCCFLATLQGRGGVAEFQVLEDGDPKRGLRAEEGENGTVVAASAGADPTVWRVEAGGANGAWYEVRLHADAEGTPKSVEWVKLQPPSAALDIVPRMYWIKGSWDPSVAHEMGWDPVRQCFHYYVTIGSSGRESFQIRVNDTWHQSLYPDEEDGHFYNQALCGPDSLGQGLMWTIGKHAFEADAAGSLYEVRLRIADTGAARDVDWVRLAGQPGQRAQLPVAAGLAGTASPAACGPAADAPLAAAATTSPEEEGEVKEEVKEGGDAGSRVQVSVLPEHRERLQRELASAAGGRGGPRDAAMPDFDADSDGEEHRLCHECGLPLPEMAYTKGANDSSAFLHGECLAKTMVRQAEAQEEERLAKEAEAKRAKRTEYGIGWRPAAASRGEALLQKLGVAVPKEEVSYALTFDPQTRSTKIVPATEPGEVVNLAYLAIALQVRVRDDREPVFSLDPVEEARQPRGVMVDAAHREAWMQAKRFEPAWLAGTSVGEVMFQADYHLKELSMGEHAQPVLGMRSASDLIDEAREKAGEEWNAREWFVVRQAALHLSENNALMPSVKMGVEAREQVRGADGLEDAKLTRPDHPLVKYAEAFSDNFDLIAERKSVIFHLRELAKAAVIAKFSVESKVLMDEAWFTLPDADLSRCPMTVPQLWNERCYSQVTVRDDGRLDEEQEMAPKFRGVYGGVDLTGLPPTSAIRPATPMQPPPPSGVRAAGVRALRHKGVRLPTSRMPPPAAEAVQAMRLASLGFEAPQGVDLSLDAFNLSEVVDKDDAAEKAGAWADPRTFWSLLSEETSDVDKEVPAEDLAILRAIFHPRLSDRREEADKFVPPDTSAGYVRHLQQLLDKEAAVAQAREDCFLSSGFDFEAPGQYFPASWTRHIRVARQGPASRPEAALLTAVPEYAAQADVLAPALRTTEPFFDRVAQDGVRFRSYRIGALEVRTITPPGKDERFAQVFRSAAAGANGGKAAPFLNDSEQIIRAAMYVEARGDPSRTPPARHYYITLITAAGNQVITEKLEDGTVAWLENPADFAERNSSAKALSSHEAAAGVCVRDMKLYKAGAASEAPASASKRKRYARAAMRRVAREAAGRGGPAAASAAACTAQAAVKPRAPPAAVGLASRRR